MSKLKNIRKSKGLSQSKLADASGVSLRMIQQYEQGTKNIQGAKLNSLADLTIALECSISDILTDEKLVEKLKKVKL